MSIIIMILLLGFLIFMHELGHFLSARALGIKVSKFALGFPIGPTLWSKKIGDVEYLIHAFLLGGYVAFPDDDKESELPLDSKDRFINRPVWQRMIVISAGVIANVIIAYFLVFFVASVWGKLPSGIHQVYVGGIQAEKTASVWQSGMKKGDLIVSINDSAINSTNIVSLYSKYSAEKDGKVEPEFAAKNLELIKKLNPQLKSTDVIKKGTKVVLPQNVIEPAIHFADKDLFDMQLFNDKYENDTRLPLTEQQIELRNKINGTKVYTPTTDISLKDLAYAVSDSVSPLNIVVERDTKQIKLKPIYPNEKGLMGIMLAASQKLVTTKTPKQIIKSSVDYLNYQTYMMCYGLWTIFTGKIKISELHGVVLIAKLGGDVIKSNGLFSGLLLTAVISINLALINFLPIPALDGGHFMFLVIEKLRGKPLNQETIEKISNIFFLLLIILMIFVIFNDIYALLMHKW